MRTGGIQGSQGPSVEREGREMRGYAGLLTLRDLLRNQIRVAQSDWTNVHTRTH